MAIARISDQNNFSFFFFIYKLSQDFLPSFESIALSVQEKFKIDFQDGDHGSHLGLTIETIFAIFNLHVSSIFPTKFRVNWHFGSVKRKRKIGFQDAAILDFRSERFWLFLIYQ